MIRLRLVPLLASFVLSLAACGAQESQGKIVLPPGGRGVIEVQGDAPVKLELENDSQGPIAVLVRGERMPSEQVGSGAVWTLESSGPIHVTILNATGQPAAVRYRAQAKSDLRAALNPE